MIELVNIKPMETTLQPPQAYKNMTLQNKLNPSNSLLIILIQKYSSFYEKASTKIFNT